MAGNIKRYTKEPLQSDKITKDSSQYKQRNNWK